MKFILAVFGVIVILIFAIILINRGAGPETGQRPTVVSEQNREGTSASYTKQGKLVGQQERRAIRIIVTQNERRLEILTGYEEAIQSAQVYANTPAAYENFLIALDKHGFENKRVTRSDDERGVCPLGFTYIYELKDFSQSLINSWNTSCGQESGNFGGQTGTIHRLFELQIPDYDKQVKDVELS